MDWQAEAPFEPSGYLVKFSVWGITVICGRIPLPFQLASGLSVVITSCSHCWPRVVFVEETLSAILGEHISKNNLPRKHIVCKTCPHKRQNQKSSQQPGFSLIYNNSDHCLGWCVSLPWPKSYFTDLDNFSSSSWPCSCLPSSSSSTAQQKLMSSKSFLCVNTVHSSLKYSLI